MTLSGWGRYPAMECRTARCRSAEQAAYWVASTDTLIPRGNGRAYGDAALNAELTLSMAGLNRLRDFDAKTGLLSCEAGVLLADILEVCVPQGWLPPVMPGTKFVTVGGMVAADVHGKNHHHSGTFGRHVEALELAMADGSIRTCDRKTHPELFRATLGGMGLTGCILSVTFRLDPIETAYVRQEALIATDLEQAMALFEESQDWTYNVAWIDCLAKGRKRGRALITRGEHLKHADLPANLRHEPLAPHRGGEHRIPLDAPLALFNGATVKLFNAAYYRRGVVTAGKGVIHYDPFFFPLDRLLDWNRLYGRRGFVQFQCVLPKSTSAPGLAALLERIGAAGAGSFLAVLKLLGTQGEGLMSFPMEGYTLAIDVPLRPGTLELLSELDKITISHGGRVYLAKDACTCGDRLREGYARLPEFENLRAETGANAKFASAMSRRLRL